MFRRILILLTLAAGLTFQAHGQAPPPSPSQQELQAPLNLDDGKPAPGASSNAGPSPWRAFFSMMLVIGLVAGGFWALKKYGGKRLAGRGGGRLRLAETLAVGDRRFVAIVRADDEEFLIGMSPQGISLLSRLHGSEPAPGDFQEALTQADLSRPMPVKELERMIQGGHS